MVGRIDDGARLYPATIGIDGFGIALAVIGAAILALRLARRRISPPLVALLVALVVYWSFIALAGRPPDSSRYIFVGAALVILIAAEALRGAQTPAAGRGGAFAVVAAALARSTSRHWSTVGPTRWPKARLLERTSGSSSSLATEGKPRPSRPHRRRSGQVRRRPGTYLEAAERLGPIGFSLERIRSGSDHVKVAADHSLALLSGIEFAPVAAIPDSRRLPRGRRTGAAGRLRAAADRGSPASPGRHPRRAGRLTSDFPASSWGRSPIVAGAG